jgi:anaerobic selenocysteine-containing dehydrogenase
VREAEALVASLETPVPALVLIGRRHLRSNNSWLHNAPAMVKGPARCTLLVHPDDAKARGLREGALVELSSRTGRVTVPIEISSEVMPSVVSLPHGWGHTREATRLSVARAHAGVSANDVTDERFLDRLSGNAAFNGVSVELRSLGAPLDVDTPEASAASSGS